MKTRHGAHSLLALGATRPWTKYWLVSEQEWGSQRGTPCPIGHHSQATCPGVFIDLCLRQGSGDRVTPFPWEALYPKRVLRVFHTEGLPPPCRASASATWGLTPGVPFSHRSHGPRWLSTTACGRSSCLSSCSSRTQGFHRALQGFDSLSRLQRLQGSVPELCPQALDLTLSSQSHSLHP